MHGSVGLLLGPARAGHKQQFGIGTDGLFVGLGGAHAGDRGARFGHGDRHGFHAGGSGGPAPRGDAAGIEQDHPGPLAARKHGFHALAVEPAGEGRRSILHGQAGGVGIHAATQAVGHAGERARPSRSRGGHHDRGARRAAKRFRCGGVGGVARFGERLAGNRQESRGAAAGRLAGGSFHTRAHQPDR